MVAFGAFRANVDFHKVASTIKAPGARGIDGMFKQHDSQGIKALRPFITDSRSVLVIGNHCSAYRDLGSVTDFRYPYQYPLCLVASSIRETVQKRILSGSDKHIVIRKNDPFNCLGFDVEKCVLSAGYKNVASEKGYVLFSKDVRCGERIKVPNGRD